MQNRVFSPQKNREINAKILNFVIDEPVWIMVKSYNSFLLDRLWIGTDLKSNPSDNDGRMQMQKYLFDHGLERSSFENMLRGMNTTRPFIPLQGQMYKGTIKGLKPDDEGPATTLVIEADVGELLFLEVPRENVFVYGHWMGKADLSYIFEKGKKVKILSKKPLDKFSRETKLPTKNHQHFHDFSTKIFYTIFLAKSKLSTTKNRNIFAIFLPKFFGQFFS